MTTKKQASEMNRANPQKTTDDNLVEIFINTLLSSRNEEGLVQFSISSEGVTILTQWDVNKAREIRDMISEGIEAAISDTLIYKFLVEKVRLNKESAAAALMDFRELRQGSKHGRQSN